MMRRLALCLALLLTLSPAGVLRAQELPTDEEALISSHYFRLIQQDGRGYAVLEKLIESSYLRDLPQQGGPALGPIRNGQASYDPRNHSALTAGIALYYLAYPIDIKLWLPNGDDRYIADMLTARILWLAGKQDKARAIIEGWIKQAEEWGWSDAWITSALADAAVLADQAGDTKNAENYLARASVCGQMCSEDFLYIHLSSLEKEDVQNTDDIGDAQGMASYAAEKATKLGIDNAEVLADIQFEADLIEPNRAEAATGRLLGLLTAPEAEISSLDKRHMNRLGLGLLKESDFILRAVAGKATLNAIVVQNGVASFDAAKLKQVSYAGGGVGRSFAPYIYLFLLPMSLMELSADPKDKIAIGTLLLRAQLMNGLPAEALTRARVLLDDAKKLELSDAQIAGLLADAALLAEQVSPAEAAIWRNRATACRGYCAEDIVNDFYRRMKHFLPLPQNSVDPETMIQIQIDLAGDLGLDKNAVAAKAYQSLAMGLTETLPIDAANFAALSLAFMEQAANSGTGTIILSSYDNLSIMNQAGRYRDVIEAATRIAKRKDINVRGNAFLAVWARALFRSGDPAAKDIYVELVQNIAAGDTFWSSAIALDLLDTSYFDLLDRLAVTGVLSDSQLARLRHREGRHAEAVAAWQRYQGSYQQDFGSDLDEDLIKQAFMVQEAVYLQAVGDAASLDRAAQILAKIAPRPWVAPPTSPEELANAPYRSIVDDSYDQIFEIVLIRYEGAYEAAAWLMRGRSDVVQLAEQHSTYLDAQTLWQMAFTFARGGDQDIAFDLMSRAARIAVNLSFEGASAVGGGTLQLLERDRWRYLLFVDIAWAQVTGKTPEDMLVVSRY